MSRYIKNVYISGFQSHADTEVELSPGINLIVGTSDVGKSAFLRAMAFLLHNQIPNADMITKGHSTVRVRAQWSDGWIVERFKSSEKNGYVLIDPEGKRVDYDKINKSIPEDVLSAMHYPPADTLHGPLDYAAQRSPLFMVGLTPSQLPKAINELLKIDEFDAAAKLLNSTTKQSATRVKEIKIRIENLEVRAQECGHVEQLSKQEIALRKKIASLQEKANKAVRGRQLVISLSQLKQEVDKHKILADKQAPAQACLASLRALYTRAQTNDKAITLCNQLLGYIDSNIDYAKIDDKAKEKAICLQELKESASKTVKAREIITTLSSLKQDHDAKSVEIETLRGKEEDLKLKLSQAREQAITDGLICTTCKQVIGSGTIV